MEKVLLFGASGNLGRAVATELVSIGYALTVVVRNQEKARLFTNITGNYMVVDVCNPAQLHQITQGFDVVISTLGKSVSPNDRSKPSFVDVDLTANTHILEEALRSGVRKFVYVSALHAERYPQLTYFRVHHEFSERLIKSGIDYSIIKPPAIFSAYADAIQMARKGQLVHLGKGDKRTNPIYEGDLAKVVVDAIVLHHATIEAGGKKIYTRRQINDIINLSVNGQKKLRTIPVFLLKSFLPLMKMIDRNTYDKFAFFTEVLTHDTLAPQIGEKTLEAYVLEQSQKD